MAESDRDSYDQMFDAGLELGRSERHATRYAAILARIPPGTESILDAGCGDGGLLARLPADLPAVGIDFSVSALRRVRGLVACASVESLCFSDRSFDLVHVGEVLEHLTTEALDRATHEMARVARRWCVVTVPNRERLALHRVACPSCGSAIHAHGHLQSFDPGRMAGLIPGFDLVEAIEVGVDRRDFPAWMARLRRSVSGERVLPGGTRCPVCGFRRPGAFDLAPAAAPWSRRALGFLATTRPAWLLATYARAGASAG